MYFIALMTPNLCVLSLMLSFTIMHNVTSFIACNNKAASCMISWILYARERGKNHINNTRVATFHGIITKLLFTTVRKRSLSIDKNETMCIATCRLESELTGLTVREFWKRGWKIFLCTSPLYHCATLQCGLSATCVIVLHGKVLFHRRAYRYSVHSFQDVDDFQFSS